jgi:hypothetical protein
MNYRGSIAVDQIGVSNSNSNGQDDAGWVGTRRNPERTRWFTKMVGFANKIREHLCGGG